MKRVSTYTAFLRVVGWLIGKIIIDYNLNWNVLFPKQDYKSNNPINVENLRLVNSTRISHLYKYFEFFSISYVKYIKPRNVMQCNVI